MSTVLLFCIFSIMVNVYFGHLFRPADCPSPLFEMMIQCHQFNPEDRPYFSTLLEKCTQCLSSYSA